METSWNWVHVTHIESNDIKGGSTIHFTSGNSTSVDIPFALLRQEFLNASKRVETKNA